MYVGVWLVFWWRKVLFEDQNVGLQIFHNHQERYAPAMIWYCQFYDKLTPVDPSLPPPPPLPGELAELKADLQSDKRERKKEAVKKVIASMTVGKDVR